jgi:hypothetical protein
MVSISVGSNRKGNCCQVKKMKRMWLLLAVVGLLSFSYGHVQGMECAWVLWRTLQSQPAAGSLGEKEWVLEAAYPDYNQCVQERKSLRDKTKKIKESFTSHGDEVRAVGECCQVITIYKDKQVMIETFYCLPDSIDPTRLKLK